MLHGIVAAGFQNVIEANHVALDVGIRVGDGIANTSLSAQIDHNVWVILLKNTVDESFIRKVALDKGIILELLKLCKPSFLDTNIIIIVHVVQANDLGIRLSGQDTFCQVGTDETGGTGNENNITLHVNNSF